jgi:hypothetical protein
MWDAHESNDFDLSESLERLLARGFELPIHLAALGVNGSVVAGRFRGDGAAKTPAAR